MCKGNRLWKTIPHDYVHIHADIHNETLDSEANGPMCQHSFWMNIHLFQYIFFWCSNFMCVFIFIDTDIGALKI